MENELITLAFETKNGGTFKITVPKGDEYENGVCFKHPSNSKKYCFIEVPEEDVLPRPEPEPESGVILLKPDGKMEAEGKISFSDPMYHDEIYDRICDMAGYSLNGGFVHRSQKTIKFLAQFNVGVTPSKKTEGQTPIF